MVNSKSNEIEKEEVVVNEILKLEEELQDFTNRLKDFDEELEETLEEIMNDTYEDKVDLCEYNKVCSELSNCKKRYNEMIEDCGIQILAYKIVLADVSDIIEKVSLYEKLIDKLYTRFENEIYE